MHYRKPHESTRAALALALGALLFVGYVGYESQTRPARNHEPEKERDETNCAAATYDVNAVGVRYRGRWTEGQGLELAEPKGAPSIASHAS